jgi:tetratricopeptide (TPR) repeat protein
MTENNKDPSPLSNLQTAAKKVPFEEMRDPLLLFGTLGLLTLLVIIFGQNWPVVLQFVIVLVVFLLTAGGYIFLQSEGYSEPYPKPVSEPLYAPSPIPFDDNTRRRLLAQVEFAERYKRRIAVPDYWELERCYDGLNQAATDLAEACGVKWGQPQPMINEEAAKLLLRLIEALFSFQDDTGRWDDLSKWSAWGYMLGSAHKEWGRTVVFAQRVAWVWFRRDKIEEMRQWVNKLSIAVAEAVKLGEDKRLKAYLEHAQGRLEFLDGHIEKAAQHLQSAISLYREAGAPHGIWEANCDLGQLETRRLKYVEAEHHLNEAMRIAEQESWDTARVECHYYYWELYRDQAHFDVTSQIKAEEVFTHLLEPQNGVQTAHMESRVRYEIALQELQRGELLNAYLMARAALNIEDSLQTASWPVIRRKIIELADLLYEELSRLNKDEAS